MIARTSKAYFSPCRTYRYSLTRDLPPPLDEGQGYSMTTVTFIGLNPSTADETVDDPTIRRCVGFARRWGFTRLKMVNVYALRATDPKALYATHGDIVGPDNDCTLAKVIGDSDLVVCAWGTHARHIDGFRASRILRLIAAPHCLGRNKDGSPKHPLYLRDDTLPEPFGSFPEVARWRPNV